MRRKTTTALPSSAVFTSLEMYVALYRTYPERFPDAPATGKIRFQAEMHGDDSLLVRYGPKP